MGTYSARVTDWLQVIRGEFEEFPDLRVTLEQARRRWTIDGDTLQLLLDAFVNSGLLARSSQGVYFTPPRRRAS